MKKLCVAVFLGACLVIILSCSSTPPGTLAIDDISAREAELLGQNVVVVGTAEIRTNMSTFNMFKVYQGGDSIWVTFPDTVTMPPQGLDIRVTGTLGKKKFTTIPDEQLYIDATSVDME